MLEVGNLANATESRSHFAMWAVMSSPLILSFDLANRAKMDQAWPIITNRRVLEVNQRWAGHPGRRLAAADAPSPAPNPPPGTPVAAVGTVVGTEWQIWAKPLGKQSHAVLLVSTGSTSQTVLSIPFANISAADFATAQAACVFDLYDGYFWQADPQAAALTTEALGAHDSAFLCVTVGDFSGECGDGCASPSCRRGCPR